MGQNTSAERDPPGNRCGRIVRPRETGSAGSKGWDRENFFRLVMISDTHGMHRELAVPDGDVLFHAGDFSNAGEEGQIEDLMAWMGGLKHSHIVVIAGNHDVTLHPSYYEAIGRARFHRGISKPYSPKKIREMVNSKCTYLEDEYAILKFGNDLDAGNASGKRNELRVYGSPWQPEFCDWAFNLKRGKPCDEKWSLIPGSEHCKEHGVSGVDVLLTHGPPHGHGDLCAHGEKVGCEDLLKHVEQRVKPAIHLFGHIHEGYGVTWSQAVPEAKHSSKSKTMFVNASSCTLRYQATNAPVVVDFPRALNSRNLPKLVSPKLDWTKSEVLQWMKDQNLPLMLRVFSSPLVVIDGQRLITWSDIEFDDHVFVTSKVATDLAGGQHFCAYMKEKKLLAKEIALLRAVCY